MSIPTERTSAGMRSVPRITPTAPPSTPIRTRARPRDRAGDLTRPRGDRPEREVDPAPDEHRRDQPVEERLGDVVGEERAGDGAGGRRKRDPGDHAPVDPSFTRVPQASGPGSGGRDRDVRAGGASGLPVASTMNGSRSVPRTSPSIEPR